MKGFVYSVRSKSRPDLVYYGSTKRKLSQRMASHRDDAKNGRGCTSIQIVLLGDAYIELEETVEYTDKQELVAVENMYIRQEECVNKMGKGPNKAANKEKALVYRQAHKEELKAKYSARYQANKEDAKAKAAVRYQANKERYLEASRRQREGRDPVAWAAYCNARYHRNA